MEDNEIKENGVSIAHDVKFKNTPLVQSIPNEKKRKKQNEAELEAKRQAEEEYNRKIHEQRYKRLMHLLNRSQFYASYIGDKISIPPEGNVQKKTRKSKKKGKAVDENTPPEENGKKKNKMAKTYDLREYIPGNVQDKLKRNKLNLSEEEIEDELLQDLEDDVEGSHNESVNVSKYFNGELRDYQIAGLQWLKVLYENGINGILADEMGLGKTVQVIALLCHLIEKKQDGPYLIVAPLSTIPNWMIEFEQFAPDLPVVVLHGSPDTRLHAQKEIRRKHNITTLYKTQPIVITTFEVPLVESRFLQSQNWRYIIIDEGHRIKNHECQLVKVLRSTKSMNRLLLTGTPLQNNLAELWSLLNFLLPEIFDDLAVFQSWFNATDLQHDEGAKKFLEQEQEKHVLSSLREILKPFMLRREKADVCLDIPPKKELIVYAPLTEIQHDLYTAVLNRDLQTLSKIEETPIITNPDGTRPKRKCVLRNLDNGMNYSRDDREMTPDSSYKLSNESNDDDVWKQVKSNDKKNLSMWKQYTDITDRNRDYLIHIQFRNTGVMYKKIVNHPYLIHCPLDDVGLPKIDEDLVRASGKLLVLDAMLKKLRSRGHKVLLFSTMTLILDMIEDYLSLRDFTYVRLDGRTKIEERKENINTFNKDPNMFLFLISTRAGGIGLNLAAADTVIMYDSDWNPQVDIQAMARCHRIGQRRPVVIYKFCTKGTIDEAIINRSEAKRILEKIVISKKMQALNLHNKETLLELKRFIESKECQIVASENEVFTEAELNKLLDRSDMKS